jgi:hypothetical protein
LSDKGGHAVVGRRAAIAAIAPPSGIIQRVDPMTPWCESMNPG